MSEKYQPTPEEEGKGEKSITDEQPDLGKSREEKPFYSNEGREEFRKKISSDPKMIAALRSLKDHGGKMVPSDWQETLKDMGISGEDAHMMSLYKYVDYDDLGGNLYVWSTSNGEEILAEQH